MATAARVGRRHVGALWRYNSGVETRSTWRNTSIRLPQCGPSALRCFSSQGSAVVNSEASASSSATIIQDVVEQQQGIGSGAADSILEPLVPYIEQLPELLHLPPSAHSYALSIVIFTVALRTCITLPATLWQRKRTKRMASLVVPEWEKLKEDLPEKVARRCRKEGKSYEVYTKELKKELKAQLRMLCSKHKCSPMTTLVVPVLVHFPLFIGLSFLLRASLLVSGSPITLETLPWWMPPADQTARFEATTRMLAERGVEGETLRKLTMMEGPTLAESDKTMLGPVALGLLTMSSVELGQWLRRGMTSESLEEEKQQAKQEEKFKSINTGRRGREPAPVEVDLAPIRAKALGNTLRAAAIGFVAVSSQAPAGVLIYWLTSASYTIVQNSVFALLDRRRAKMAGKGVKSTP